MENCRHPIQSLCRSSSHEISFFGSKEQTLSDPAVTSSVTNEYRRFGRSVLQHAISKKQLFHQFVENLMSNSYAKSTSPEKGFLSLKSEIDAKMDTICAKINRRRPQLDWGPHEVRVQFEMDVFKL